MPALVGYIWFSYDKIMQNNQTFCLISSKRRHTIGEVVSFHHSMIIYLITKLSGFLNYHYAWFLNENK